MRIIVAHALYRVKRREKHKREQELRPFYRDYREVMLATAAARGMKPEPEAAR